MKNSIAFLPGSFMVYVAVVFSSSTSFASLEFDPYAYTGVHTDSNLFRSPENEESETIWRLGAGFKSDFKLSRQHLLLNLDETISK